jgi:hypothetical protein
VTGGDEHPPLGDTRRARPGRAHVCGGALAAVLGAVALLAGCRAPTEGFDANWDQRGGSFDPAERVVLRAARAKLAAGELEAARGELVDLLARDPENIEVGVWLQEVELALLAAATRGEELADEQLARLARDEDPVGALRRRYARAADETPSVTRQVLAARIAAEPEAALLALDAALALDPQSAWALYGRAHALIEQRRLANRWSLARDALDAALRAEPGFLRARRLRAWMLAEEGQYGAALTALDAWLAAAEDDPRVAEELRVEAELDRVLLLLLAGRPERAARQLAELEGTDIGRTRRLALLAVAEQERGELERALQAIRTAEVADRGSVLPLVQRALLLERFQDDPEGAEELWRAIAERDSGSDIADLVQTMRARVRLERREASQREDAALRGEASDGVGADTR